MIRPSGGNEGESWLTTLRLAIWGRWWSALLLIVVLMILIPVVARFY